MISRSPILILLAAAACGGAIDQKDGTSSGSSGSTTTPPSTPGASSSSSGGPIITPTPSAGSCALSVPAPISEDFEKGLNPTWGSTNAANFTIDQKRPLSGTRSLLGTFKTGESSFLTVRLPSVCAIRIAFLMRADATFLKGSTTFLRITTERAQFHLRVQQNIFSIAQIGSGSGASYMKAGGVIATLLPDAMTKLSFSIDVIKARTETLVSSEGDPTPTKPTTDSASDPGGALLGGISAVDIGISPGIQNVTTGSLWLDDFTIE